jgi:Flp pilus assembly protein TadD
MAATVPFLVALSRLARRAVLGENGTGDLLGVAAVGGLVAAGIDSLFFFDLHEMTSAMSIWLVVGIIEAAARATTPPLRTPGDPMPPGGRPWWRRGLGDLKPWVAVLVSVTLVAAFWLWAVRPGMAAYFARRGMVALRTGYAPHAISLLQRARDWDPRHSPAYALLGQALQVEGRHDEAIQAFQESLLLNPMDIVALDSLGILYRMTGRAAEAREMYQRSLGINPYVGTTHKYLGDLLLAEGKAGEASVRFRRALELVPRYAAAANALALAYVQSGRLDEAEVVFKQAVASDPGFAEAWLILFMVRGSRGEWPEAAKALAQLLRLHPSMEAAARRSPFFPQVWAAGVSMGILPVGAQGSPRHP